MAINITLEQANEITSDISNGCINGYSTGKGGRVWLEGEFLLSELEAICVICRAQAGENAEGAEELIKIQAGL